MISLRPFQKTDTDTYLHWAKLDHVKNTWFVDGYETPEEIYTKLPGNGYDFPLIIELDQNPIGYIVYCDLSLYKKYCINPKDLFFDEPAGTVCFDIFIGEKEKLGKGYGTVAVNTLCKMLFEIGFKRILIDPFSDNKRAISFYQNCGFQILRKDFDGIYPITIMVLNI